MTDAGDYVGDNLQTNRDMEFETTTIYREQDRKDIRR
jgi:hypothetical protein